MERVVTLTLILLIAIGISFSYYNRLSTKDMATIPQKAALKTEESRGIISDRRIIDINNADRYTLTRLNGIGPQLAQRIIDYRRENGPFSSPEELMDVKGIGPKKYEAFKDRIRVDE